MIRHTSASSRRYPLTADSSLAERPARQWPALLIGAFGLLAALALPFAPVIADETTVTWPAAGQPVESSTAMFVPYRPTTLTATVPCSSLRAADARADPVTVLATGEPGDGLLLQSGFNGPRLQLDDRVYRVAVPVGDADCRLGIDASPAGVSIRQADGRVIDLAGEPVPNVFAFRTDLDPAEAAGMTVTADVASPFGTSPSAFKIVLIAGQLLAASLAIGLLTRAGRLLRGSAQPIAQQPRKRSWWRTAWVDGGVIGLLAGWAIIGPLSVDDGWGTMMARNFAATGNTGNYYRWWNASETPFALAYQLPAPLTDVSLAPLWLRVPSTILAIATWFVLSRGILPAALPRLAGLARIRLLAAACLLAAWLPFNLGARSESYVAFGVTAVLAILWRARGPAALGWAALAAVVTVALAPTAVLLVGPLVLFAPRIVSILRTTARSRTELFALVMLLCCIAATVATIVFADETWDALVTATRWHTAFGPSLPWYREPERYVNLLGESQQGSGPKRVPVLLTAALLPVVAALAARRTERGDADRAAVRMAAVVIVALVALCLVPSKWSYHLGAAAGLFASFLVVAVVALLEAARKTSSVHGADRFTGVIAVLGGAMVAAAAGLAFTGPNAWWMPALYDVPWASEPIRPSGLPLNSMLFWIGVLALVWAAAATTAARRAGARISRSLAAGPAVVALAAIGTVVLVLAGSFVAAPSRRPAASLASSNVRKLVGGAGCGLADDIEVLPDGEVLAPTEPPGRLDGFAAQTGFDPGTPPPDPPGVRTSTELWGSRLSGQNTTGTMTSPWFALPTLGPEGGVALSVSGRVAEPNTLVLEFGRAGAGAVETLGESQPIDRVSPELDLNRSSWRTIGVDARQVPPRADRVRIRAEDASSDPASWLAFTGPRLRSAVGLTEFLSARGPVLVNWPLAFVFPCVRDIPRVAGGLAEAPQVLIEEPVPWSTAATDQTIGGSFAGLVPLGNLFEVATQVVGHPDIDWGTLRLTGDDASPDAYGRSVTRTTRSGHA